MPRVRRPCGAAPENQFGATRRRRTFFNFGIVPPKGRQPAGALQFDESFKSFPNQGRFLFYPSELLGDEYEIVIQRNGCSHRKPKALMMASRN